ncbi:hypothetical protein NKI78_04465 [Mesorhizobium sp. M0400]|uniref:hypothetical protein n=1 Tax=Mesorhizobium sp. M0400 TaxID=2956941 RepID=UPI003337F9C9
MPSTEISEWIRSRRPIALNFDGLDFFCISETPLGRFTDNPAGAHFDFDVRPGFDIDALHEVAHGVPLGDLPGLEISDSWNGNKGSEPMAEAKRNPIMSFQLTRFDPDTGTLIIQIHPSILVKSQENALEVKAIEIISEGSPGITKVMFVPRED